MKLFGSAIILLCLLVVVQFLHYTGQMPEWTYNSRVSHSKALAECNRGYKVSFLFDETTANDVKIIINGRERGDVRPELTIDLYEGDVLEIDAGKLNEPAVLKIKGENNKIPPGWPKDLIIEKCLYMFPKVVLQ